MFFYPFLDASYLLLIPALILAIYAQIKVRSAYARGSQIMARGSISGAEAAVIILRNSGIYDVGTEAISGRRRTSGVRIERTMGQLTDHYDPRSRVLRLSPDVYSGRSVAALGIAAHESGHAIQHAVGYFPLHLRTSIYPLASFGSWLAFPIFFLGFLFRSPSMMDLGILVFSLAVMFTVITLPVEFNASSRALSLLRSNNIVGSDELPYVKKVLSAAALTYVAATAMALLQLLRLIVLRNTRD